MKNKLKTHQYEYSNYFTIIHNTLIIKLAGCIVDNI